MKKTNKSSNFYFYTGVLLDILALVFLSILFLDRAKNDNLIAGMCVFAGLLGTFFVLYSSKVSKIK